MQKYRIADFTVELIDCGKTTMHNAKKYLIETDAETDFKVCSSRENAMKRYPGADLESALYLWEGCAFTFNLLERNGMRLHSSAVVVDDKAYLFSAPCGTGKSTHTGKWLELFGDRAYILNDDKPAIRIFNDGIYAYGTPWSGKNDISVNKKVPVQGICFLYRDTVNTVTKITGTEVLINMLTGCLKRLDRKHTSLQLDVVNKIIEQVPIYKMGCTPTVEAAQLAYDTMRNA